MGSQPSKETNTDSKTFDFNEKDNSSEPLATRFSKLDLESAGLSAYSDSLSVDTLAGYSKKFNQDNKNLLARNAIIGNDPTQVLLNPKAALSDKHVFNVKLDLEGSATNQKSSGRCWLFAGCNVMRLAVIQKYKLDDNFELSQSYLFFYGK